MPVILFFLLVTSMLPTVCSVQTLLFYIKYVLNVLNTVSCFELVPICSLINLLFCNLCLYFVDFPEYLANGITSHEE